MSKQSSIDWLLKKIWWEYRLIPNDDIIEEAKAMHKEEMFEYIKQKYCIGQMSLEFHRLEFEQYYNETFGGQDNE